ncbi:hypothetical protein GP486_001790 [Trichoglossum hirsutum]|uniref:non-specific serine/threonine protein kinase n=1 Tax=Trichoglossum hirsutum TaxID=265104 RepID=A0A9P8LG07_9PEZI|nr:hypothetical protein GP486_001790 [Trichoglossum hirsutum]
MFDRPETPGGPTLAIADFERAIVAIVPSAETRQSQLSDSDFDAISRLLSQVGKAQWSHRPRTYAVLRMIDRIDLFDTFILDGRKDIAFPYVESRLPTSLSPAVKERFLRAQKLVLTKASDLEKSDGRHRHLDQDADTHFHILGILGRGGFGEVDHVRSKLSLEEYARKRMYRKRVFSRDKMAMQTFENELANLKRLSHRHLVKLVGSYTDPKFIGLLMSPVADCDLKAFLEREPFPKGDLYLLRGFFGCLCSAVLYLHNSKCRHKDLKPGNILVYKNKVLITDFGTARDWSDQSHSTTIGKSSAYTPGYAAPEVVDQEPRNTSADIWSLGCIYLDMATILRGESMTSKNRFFSKNGTGGANPRTNPEALELWLARLKSEIDGQPLEWIKQMVRRLRNERLTAAGLMEQIHSHQDEHVYYNSCCHEEEESEDESSYQGSVFEGDTNATKDSKSSVQSRAEGEVADTAVSISSGDFFKEYMPGAPPLKASSSDNQEENKIAIHRSEDVDAKDNKDGRTALHSTSSEPKGSPQEDSRNGRTALHATIDETRRSSRSTEGAGNKEQIFPLHHAAASGNLKAVIELLDQGSDIDLRDEHEDTPLDAATKDSGNGPIIGLLLSRGARACSKMTKDQVRSLVESGVAHVQVSRKHEVDEWLGINSIRQAITYIDPKNPTVRELLLPLHHAAENGSLIAVQELLDRGGWDKDMKDTYGETPLDVATRNHDKGPVIGLLLSCGARACSEKTKDQIRSLVESGIVSVRSDGVRGWLRIEETSSTRHGVLGLWDKFRGVNL